MYAFWSSLIGKQMLMLSVFWLLILPTDFWRSETWIEAGPGAKHRWNRRGGTVGWKSQRNECLTPGLYQFVQENLRNWLRAAYDDDLCF